MPVFFKYLTNTTKHDIYLKPVHLWILEMEM